MVKLDKKLVLAGSTAMLGGYAGFFLVAPVLAYKTFFRGGVIPGAGENEEVDKEPTKANVMTNRWCGLMMLQNVVNTVCMTKLFEENLDDALKCNSFNWAAAAAMHLPALLTKSQPKELCIQQMVTMPIIAALSLMAANQE